MQGPPRAVPVRVSAPRRIGRAVVPFRWRPFVWRICHIGPPLPVSRWRFAGPWPWPNELYRDQPVERFVARQHQRVHLAVRRTASDSRPLPDFLCIGTPKSGTTSLHAYLRVHPQVAPAVRKEIRFFLDPHYRHGVSWYRAHFPLAAQRAGLERRLGLPTFTGDISPGYFHNTAPAARIASLLPSARIVLLLRDPATRTVSEYQMRRRNGREHRSLPAMVEDELTREWRPGCGRYPYIEASYYAKHLRRWYEHFDRDQILVVPTDTLTRDGGTGFARILAFIGLGPQETPAWETNVGAYHHDAEQDDVLALLREHFRPHDDELWSLIGERWTWGAAEA